ncbi:hypothetical protein EYD45_14715 [Hyunsoonleella flava]|uniref:Lipoprotein n=1 Tax=Hyunsoonleella flava TaxID=2527939 RepID=A0A4Q9FBR5_9FLAO|nr:hypothetical protein [Hyunsoonleella flava]TBN00188.1 hypothetical protein EYD45_14715 [Hyunsoonleella flava]
MKNILFTFLIIIALFSCKDNTKEKTKNENGYNENTELKEDPKLQVLINAIILENDVFEVYYYELGQDTFHPKDFVFTKVIGKPESQDIIFILPEKTYPERLRLDFGKIKTQKPIKLNHIKILYGNKEYTFSEDEIRNEFKASKYLDFNKNKFLLSPREIEGRYDPYLYTKKVSNIVNYLIED